MADDPEPRGSRSGDNTDVAADAESEATADSSPDVTRGDDPDSDAVVETGGVESGDESEADEPASESADGDTGTDPDATGADRFEAAVGDRVEDGTPADGSGDVDIDGTEAATSEFEFGSSVSDGTAADADTDDGAETTVESEPAEPAEQDPDPSGGFVDTDAARVDGTVGQGDEAANSDTAATTTSSDSGAAVMESPDVDGSPTVSGDFADSVSASGQSFDDDGVFDGPDSDVEMPLADHIEEMVRRLGIVFILAGVVAVVVFPIADDLVNFLWNSHIPGATTIESRRPRLYGPLELILTEFKVAGLAGFVVGLPVFVYQTYRFMRPGLYPKERKYYLAAVPTSLILAFVGVAFAHFVVLPAIFAYFTSYTIGTAVIAFGLKETFGLILVLMGYMALVFQIPLFIMLAIMMNLVTRRWLTEKRLLFWGGFLGVSFLVSPDPTGMAPIIIAATMIVLFEGTLLLLRWVNR
ncbi:twin-arginine translocase subunit TatC [Salinigranum marinum]|uniref:twin-arginine translocase subunit TatC n=1 Tax=Salinigranum marinum TaxID=1515595 RepID=UPI002989BC4C|nr:twin-arginine translocase subunit TatC [Salinigranum marinum]